MGWKPGKLLKKAFKGVKKVVKKIGKGIKKVAFKVFGALGKIGPLGQLALMFMGIPPVISNFFGSIGGAVGGWISSVAPNMAKAFNAIKTAGQGAFSTITEAIGNGVDRVMNFTKGKGFTLSGDKTSIFGGVSAKDIPVSGTITPETAAKFGPQIPDVSDITGENLFSSPIDAAPASLDYVSQSPSLSDVATQSAAPKSLLAKDATAEVLSFEDAMKIDFGAGDKVADKTFGERTKDYFTGQVEDFTDTFKNPGQALGEAVKQGGLQAASGLITRKLMGDSPTQKVQHINMGQFMSQTTQQPLDATTWNNINTTYQKAGSSFGAAGDAMTPYFTELANFDNDINYQRQMASLNPVFNPIR